MRHHIWPQEYGGPTRDDNLVSVCDTGHYNIHAVLDALIKGQTPPKATKKETQLAQLGYQRIQQSRSAR